MIVISGEPVAKPRQTRADKWKKRPCVMRYRAWADLARAVAADSPCAGRYASYTLRFYLPIPAGYTKKKRAILAGTYHDKKPDIDNLIKAVLDALLPDGDERVAYIQAEKRWDDGKGPRVEIE